MQQDVLKRLTDAVRTFNVRADRARRRGLPVVVEARAFAAPGGGRVFHLDILRTMPVGADLKPETQDEQCAAEIALLSAAEEINRLADEAQRQHVKIELRMATDAKTAHDRQVELVLPELL